MYFKINGGSVKIMVRKETHLYSKSLYSKMFYSPRAIYIKKTQLHGSSLIIKNNTKVKMCVNY